MLKRKYSCSIGLRYLYNCCGKLTLTDNALLYGYMRNKKVFSCTTFSQISCRNYSKKTIVKESKGKGKNQKSQLPDEEILNVVRVDVMRHQMQSVVERMKEKFVQQLSVRSAAGSIENLPVVIEKEEHPLHQIAQIHKKSQHLIVVNMTNFPEGLKPTMEAIKESQMNLNPQQEGTLIYIPLPKLTREHRESLAKNAKVLSNKAKDEIRDIQNKFIKDAKNKDTFSEDLIFQVQNELKIIAGHYAGEAEQLQQVKQKELLGEM